MRAMRLSLETSQPPYKSPDAPLLRYTNVVFNYLLLFEDNMKITLESARDVKRERAEILTAFNPQIEPTWKKLSLIE